MAIPSDVYAEAVKRLKADFKFKDTGEWLSQGICPACNKKEFFCHGKEPYVVKCGRQNKCGHETDIKELYPDIFTSFNERYQATEKNPNATADAYMDFGRGFPHGPELPWPRLHG